VSRCWEYSTTAASWFSSHLLPAVPSACRHSKPWQANLQHLLQPSHQPQAARRWQLQATSTTASCTAHGMPQEASPAGTTIPTRQHLAIIRAHTASEAWQPFSCELLMSVFLPHASCLCSKQGLLQAGIAPSRRCCVPAEIAVKEDLKHRNSPSTHWLHVSLCPRHGAVKAQELQSGGSRVSRVAQTLPLRAWISG
jgi:hypothetical protein